jgi:7,8-dihydropterin-6-yl-methyl-4-(beta-D-ribofuranosyl)aminobenzene 5'-phosphate synthase
MKLRVPAAAVAALVLLAGSSPASTQTPAKVRALRILILSTMLAEQGIGEWGFAALVEADGRRTLFDTGARPRTVLENARELGIDLGQVDEVVLSHNHSDHTGGLLTLRSELAASRRTALGRAHVARGIFWPRPGQGRGALLLKEAYEKGGGVFVEHDGPTELSPGVWLTGPVPRVHAEQNWSRNPAGGGVVTPDRGEVEDTIPEDQSLVFVTDEGLVILSGCGHAGVVNTSLYARKIAGDSPVHALVGGFHLFALDEPKLDWTAAELKALGVRHFLGAHCTGLEPVYHLRGRLGLPRASAAVGAVGASFVLGKGIDPLRLAR